MQRLSGAATEQFDLCGVLSVPGDFASLGSRRSAAKRSDQPDEDYYSYVFLIILTVILFAVGGILLVLIWMET